MLDTTLLIVQIMFVFTATHFYSVTRSTLFSDVDKLSIQNIAVYVTSSVHIQCV
jgi:hypothetical protein